VKNEELEDVISWLRTELEGADASLSEEWLRLSDPEAYLQAQEQDDSEPEELDITRDERAFLVLLRNAVWTVVAGVARQNFARVAEQLRDLSAENSAWDEARLSETFAPFFEEYETLRTDPVARSPRHLTVEKSERTWELRQSLVDPEEDLGWALLLVVDVNQSRERGRPVILLREVFSG
jgi:hypothetical protein